MMISRFLTVLAGCAILGWTAGCAKKAAGEPSDRAPAWRLPDLQGRERSLSDFKGKVVILDFWATWCAPCRTEIPDFIALQKKYADRGLVIIGLSLDQQGPEVVKKFVEQLGVNYSILIADEDVTEAYRVTAIPTTFVIDREGRLRHQKTGPIKDLAEYERQLTALF